MKKYFLLIFLCAVSIMITPLAVCDQKPASPQSTKAEESTTKRKAETTTKPAKKEETVQVFRSEANKSTNMTMFEYVCGSVAAEMPLAYDEEAIKAQAIACYTNAKRLKNASDGKGKYLTDDITIHQGYIDKEQRRKKWGDSYEIYEEKLETAVKEIYGKAVYYENKLCVCSFFAISNGKTEDAKNMWKTKIPYLVSKDSGGDAQSPKFESEETFTKEEFIKCASKLKVDVKKIKGNIKVTKRTEAGTVTAVKLGDKTFTGEEIRHAFGLRSPTFKIDAKEKSITFTVFGYGHGIGMSQYGANVLAQKGYTYNEILKHYYTGVTVK